METQGDVIQGMVLDVCCGVGFNSILAASQPRVTKVVGIDFNELAISRAKAHAEVGVVEGVQWVLFFFLHCTGLYERGKEKGQTRRMRFVYPSVLSLSHTNNIFI